MIKIRKHNVTNELKKRIGFIVEVEEEARRE